MRQETEAVFLSYSYYRLEIDREQSGESIALATEIEEGRQPDSVFDSVGRQLAIIGDDINERYETEFNNILRTLNPNVETAYSYFKKIASSLFESGINWGRILTLLGFGYRMAVYVFRNGHHGYLRIITHWLARYVVESKIAQWIASNGGWVAFLKLTNYSFKYVLLALGVTLLLQFLHQRFS
ncbi:bcl-2 homologous antagonist/killer [Rhinophrynus dorsalis]